MRERGLMAARADELDRRNVRLSLTADGKGVQRALQLQGLRLGARAVDGSSVVQRRQSNRLLARVKANLEREG